MDQVTSDRALGYEAQLQLLALELDEVAEAYRIVTARWLADWYDDEAKRALTAQPDKAAELSDDELTALHDQISHLIDGVDVIVAVHLGDVVWPHHGADEEILAADAEMVLLPESVDAGQRRAMGAVGEILVQHGFGKAVDVSLTDATSYDWRIDSGHVEYPFLVTISEEAKLVFTDYCERWPILQVLVREKHGFDLERQRSEVLDRWENLDT
jgi:hypothetical protein